MPDPVTLDSVFQDTAAAVREAQSILDLWSYTAPAAYAIPQVSVQAEFDLKSVVGQKVLIFFGSKSSTEQKQSIQFTLKHTPDPEPPPADPGPPAMRVFEPPFMVSLPDRRAVLQTLLASLAQPTFNFTSGGTSSVAKEIKRLNKLLTYSEPDAGLVFLCLDRSAGRYLIAALGKHPEGIFILQGTTVTVYSLLGHRQDAVYFAPFHEMTECFRRWTAAGMPRILAADPQPPAQLGAIDAQAFATGLWAAYHRTRAESDPSRSGYDLSDVTAQMTYQSATGDNEPADSYVQSEVDLTLPGQRPSSVTVELRSPEYIVTGATRDRFLAALQQEMGALMDAIRDAEERRRTVALYDSYYEAALNDPERVKTAIVLLSYDDDRPVNEFLVCWTGEIDGAEREFAFTCELADGLLRNFALALPLEDPIEPQEMIVGAQNPFQLATVDGGAYAAILNTLHAQRVWDVNGEWIIKSGEGSDQ